MNALQQNPVTGFLESPSPNGQTFSSDKKTQFIAIAQEFLDKGLAPDIPAICRKVGITTRTYWNHINQDGEFREQWDEIRYQLEDKLVGNLFDQAKRPNCVAANIFLLKNWVPERYADNPQDKSSFDFSWLKKLSEVLKPPVIATDAVITSTQTPNNERSDLK